MLNIINQPNRRFTFANPRALPRPGLLPFDFRLSTIGLFLIFSLLTVQSCGLDVEDPTPPSPPVWVQKSLPEEWPERGIDAHESGGIYLEWEPNPIQEDISAYHIYRAKYYHLKDSLTSYELISRLELETTSVFDYLDTQIWTDTLYFYKLKVEDYSDNLSFYSDSVGYLLLRQPKLEKMHPNEPTDSLGDHRTLTWSVHYNIKMENYCVTILSEDNIFIWRQMITPSNYVDGIETWTIPDNVNLTPGIIYKWRVDLGGQYIEDRETTGSESPWAKFLYVTP
jgi:hypothetical protein